MICHTCAKDIQAVPCIGDCDKAHLCEKCEAEARYFLASAGFDEADLHKFVDFKTYGKVIER